MVFDFKLVIRYNILMKYDYKTTVKWLQNAVVAVTFRREDNVDRFMRCTLMTSRLPSAYQNLTYPEMTAMFSSPAPTISVWDVDAGSWNTIQPDHIINMASIE